MKEALNQQGHEQAHIHRTKTPESGDIARDAEQAELQKPHNFSAPNNRRGLLHRHATFKRKFASIGPWSTNRFQVIPRCGITIAQRPS